MIPIAILAGVLIALFAGAFISKRRFGLLGLALTAGATISTLWGFDAQLVVASTGIVRDTPLSEAVVQSVLVLLPALLLLFHGYTYKNFVSRFIGSLLFAVLALAFLVVPLGHVLPLQGIGATAYNWVVANKGAIISGGVVLAVLDLFFTKPARKAEKDHKH